LNAVFAMAARTTARAATRWLNVSPDFRRLARFSAFSVLDV